MSSWPSSTMRRPSSHPEPKCSTRKENHHVARPPARKLSSARTPGVRHHLAHHHQQRQVHDLHEHSPSLPDLPSRQLPLLKHPHHHGARAHHELPHHRQPASAPPRSEHRHLLPPEPPRRGDRTDRRDARHSPPRFPRSHHQDPGALRRLDPPTIKTLIANHCQKFCSGFMFLKTKIRGYDL